MDRRLRDRGGVRCCFEREGGKVLRETERRREAPPPAKKITAGTKFSLWCRNLSSSPRVSLAPSAGTSIATSSPTPHSSRCPRCAQSTTSKSRTTPSVFKRERDSVFSAPCSTTSPTSEGSAARSPAQARARGTQSTRRALAADLGARKSGNPDKGGGGRRKRQEGLRPSARLS